MKLHAGDEVSVPLATTIGRAVARMLDEYGPQGWWPVRAEQRHFGNSRGERGRRGYHPAEFGFPKTRRGRWEVVCGAVLTQNTAWTNVERALDGLLDAGVSTPEAILACSRKDLSSSIRPAGYFNQKSEFLTQLARWFIDNDRAIHRVEPSAELLERLRPNLLRVKGVGPETADSILLYAYQLPTFVVDTYTRRVFGRLEIVSPGSAYESIRQMFQSALRLPDVHANVRTWQEAHALIVEHAKRFHGRSANPQDDFLLELL
jgi:endonuclease III related protein